MLLVLVPVLLVPLGVVLVPVVLVPALLLLISGVVVVLQFLKDIPIHVRGIEPIASQIHGQQCEWAMLAVSARASTRGTYNASKLINFKSANLKLNANAL